MLMDNPFKFAPAHVMKLHAKSKKLNTKFVANLTWQHQLTINIHVYIYFMREICTKKNIYFVFMKYTLNFVVSHMWQPKCMQYYRVL